MPVVVLSGRFLLWRSSRSVFFRFFVIVVKVVIIIFIIVPVGISVAPGFKMACRRTISEVIEIEGEASATSASAGVRANGLVGDDRLADAVLSVVVHILVETVEVVSVATAATRAEVGVMLGPFAVLLSDPVVADLLEARGAVAVHLLNVVVLAIVVVPQAAPASVTATMPRKVNLVLIYFISLNTVTALLRFFVLSLSSLKNFIGIFRILAVDVVRVFVLLLMIEIEEYVHIAK